MFSFISPHILILEYINITHLYTLLEIKLEPNNTNPSKTPKDFPTKSNLEKSQKRKIRNRKILQSAFDDILRQKT